jgi:hypothetical protein
LFFLFFFLLVDRKERKLVIIGERADVKISGLQNFPRRFLILMEILKENNFVVFFGGK